MKTRSLPKFIRGLILDMKNFIRNLRVFTVKNFEHFDTSFLNIEIFKVLNGENPQIMNEIFHIRDETSYDETSYEMRPHA